MKKLMTIIIITLIATLTFADNAHIYLKGGKIRVKEGNALFNNTGKPCFGAIPESLNNTQISDCKRLSLELDQYPPIEFKVKKEGMLSIILFQESMLKSYLDEGWKEIDEGRWGWSNTDNYGPFSERRYIVLEKYFKEGEYTLENHGKGFPIRIVFY